MDDWHEVHFPRFSCYIDLSRDSQVRKPRTRPNFLYPRKPPPSFSIRNKRSSGLEINKSCNSCHSWLTIQGRVTGFVGASLTSYTSFFAHTEDVRDLLVHDRGVISLGPRNVRVTHRRGLQRWDIKYVFPHTTNLD